MTQNRQHSAWEDTFENERQRQVANQGGAQDAKRRIERHQSRNSRNPNRTTVSNYLHDGSIKDSEFNAVAPGLRRSQSRGSGLSFGERNARASWSSSAGEGFPRSRASSKSSLRSVAVPLIIIIVLFVAIALIVRTCMG